MTDVTRSAPRKAVESGEAALAASLEATIKRFRMYPPDHPSCRAAVEKPLSELRPILENSGRAVISLIEGSLAINGVPANLVPENSILAGAMRDLGFKSIVMEKGISGDDVSALLRFFSSRVGRNSEWGDLHGYISSNGIRFVKIDTVRYELVGEDEKVVSADVEVCDHDIAGRFENKITIEFAKLMREHPELLIGLLSERTSAEKRVCEEYQAVVDIDKLVRDIDSRIGDLSEEQIVNIVVSGLKHRASAEQSADAVDMEETLFDIRLMIEKTGNLSMVSKIKRIVAELNLVEERYLDLILEGRYSRKRLAFDQLEKAIARIESGEFDEDNVRIIPKRLEILEDREYTDQLIRKLTIGIREGSSDDKSYHSACAVVDTLVESAIAGDAKDTCDSLIAYLVAELSDVTLRMPYFGFLSSRAVSLCIWLLDRGRFDDLAGLVRAVNRFTSDEVVYADGVRDAADDFVFKVGTYDTAARLLQALKSDFERVRKVVYELLMMLRTQESALAMFEYISADHKPVRMFMLRALSEYGEVAVRAFGLAIADDKLLGGAAADQPLPLEAWYRVRNVLLVAGNTRTPQAVGLIEGFVSYSDLRVAGEVIAALEKIENERSSRLICGYLNFDNDEIRRKAVVALGNVGGPEALPYLAEAYVDNPQMRLALAPVIARAGGEQALDLLGSALMSREGGLKEILSRSADREKLALVAAISRIRSPRAVTILRDFQRQMSAGIAGFFKSTALADTVDQAIGRIQRELSTGHNEC